MRVTDKGRIRALFASAGSTEIVAELVEMIADSGALLDGHFRLQSGLHSRFFLRFGQLAFHPANAQRIAQLFLEVAAPIEEDTVILAAETAPRYLADALARETGQAVRLAGIGEMRKPEKRLLGDASLRGAQSVLIVVDVLNTGGSVSPLVELAREAGVPQPRLFAFATLWPQTPAAAFARLGVDGECLLRGRWKVHEPEACELCQAGQELLPGFEFI